MSVRVVARIRPLLDKELAKDVIVTAHSTEDGRPPTMVKIPSPKNEAEEFSFAFNSVYDQTTTQEQLFSAEVAPHLKALFQGLDLTIFAYGVTGTGKTHTMRGGLKLAERGVIPRLLSGVFRRGKKIARDSGGETTVAVSLSYYEIYNDKVFDLLEPPERRTPAGLPLREKDGRTVVVGLSERACGDLRDFERLYLEANAHRVTAATKLNAHSSRSHAILRVKVTQTSGGGAVVRESTASAIDLAGSEDNRRTDNDRERLVESAAINKSLFVLSQCIDAISRGDRRIPYRESKMTRILSLGQNRGITIMILNLAPVRSYHLDTLSSLNVSSRAKRIEVREIENEVVYKHQPPRSTTHTTTTAAGSLRRQPLRPLANAHNVHTATLMAAKSAAAAAGEKPLVKTFSVYTDRAARPAPAAAGAGAPGAASTRQQPSSAGTGTGTGVPATASSRKSGIAEKRSLDVTESVAGSSGRPSKLAKPSQTSSLVRGAGACAAAAAAAAAPAQQPTAQPAISAEQIEAMVERKVSEILASRAAAAAAAVAAAAPAAEPAAPPQEQQPASGAAALAHTVSEEVQRRLEALERRIETQEHGKPSDGLRLLLQARQAKECGDDAAALRLYEEALVFFPGRAKLLGKIEKLRARIAAKRGDGAVVSSVTADPGDAGEDTHRARERARRPVPQKRKAQRATAGHNEGGGDGQNDRADSQHGAHDGEADVEEDDADDDDDDDSWVENRRRPAAARRSRRAQATAAPFDSDRVGATTTTAAAAAAAPTPRTKMLLDVVNSRDAARIRSLHGFGAKRARDLVDYLRDEAAGDGEGGVRIGSLAQLRALPGMGGRTVERAYEGLAVGGQGGLF